MAESSCSFAVEHEMKKRQSDECAFPYHCYSFAFEVDLIFLKNFDDSSRGTGGQLWAGFLNATLTIGGS